MMRYLVLCLLLFSITNVYAGKMYQWVDEEGVTHYTQTPPPRYVGAEERTLKPQKPETQEVEQAEEDVDPLEALKKARAENCQKARANLAKLTSSQEVVSLVTGNETQEELAQMKPMTLEERERQTTTVQGFIAEFCQNIPPEQDTTEQNDAEPE